MLSRVLSTVAVTTGLVLSAIGVVVVPAVALTGVVLGVLLGAVASLGAREISPGGVPATARACRRVGLITSGAVVTGWLVLTGLVILLGSASGFVILTFLVVAPVMWLLLRLGDSQCGAGDTRAVGSDEPPVAAAQLLLIAPGELSTLELCLAWRRSYVVLLDVPAGPCRGDLVRIREYLLDELERRDSDGFTRWLDAGARAGSDPSRYLAADPVNPEP